MLKTATIPKKPTGFEGLPEWFQEMAEHVAYMQKDLAYIQKVLHDFDKFIAQGYDLAAFDWDAYGIPCHFVERRPTHEWFDDCLNFIHYVGKFPKSATWYFYHVNKLDISPAPEPDEMDWWFEDAVEENLKACPTNPRLEI